jgi:hypothetical protein
MVYILTHDRPLNSYEEWQSHWSEYRDYLASVRTQLPPAAYDFATAPWHYDFADHRAPHDGWVDEVIILLVLFGCFTGANATGWRGTVPLHSTRSDVERLLGAPTGECKCLRSGR